MSAEDLLKTAEEKTGKTIAAMEKEFQSVRAGRATPAVLDKITVDYYGAPTPINQMAAVSVPEGRVLQIQPWDISTLSKIAKAIQASDIGINPTNDGKVIRLVFPPLTEERRKELTREVRKMAEEAKVSVRGVRRDTLEKLKALKKSGEITEDDLSDAEKKAQNLTDRRCREIDEVTAAKEKEIMEI